jgi:arginyl-tRNA synthetase
VPSVASSNIMDLEKQIISTLQQAFKELFDYQVGENELSLQPTRKEFEGSYTFVVFPYLKTTKLNPEASAPNWGNF